MSKTPKLKKPIEILISARNSGGLLCSVVRTVDGGAASVTWDFKTKSWVFAKGLTIGSVFAAKPASASEIIAGDVPSSMAWLDEDEDSREVEDYEEKMKEVEGVCNPIMQKVYSQAQGGMPGGMPPGGMPGGMPRAESPDNGPTVEEVD